MRLAASSLYHSKSALGAYHRRMKARLGAPKAITATAHKLACLIYAMLKFGTEYVDRGPDSYERRYQSRILHSHASRSSARLQARQERGFPAGAQFTGVKDVTWKFLRRSRHDRPPAAAGPSVDRRTVT